VPEIISDAELVSKYAQQVQNEPEIQIETKAPADSMVSLPGGYVMASNEVVTTAEVRELTGADEEAISRSGSISKSLQTLLQRGLLKLGNEEATKEHLDNLLAGDRDAILLGIRRITFGDTFELMIRCPHCSEQQECSIHLVNDVPVRKLENQNDRTWEVKTRTGKVLVTLPNGSVQKKLMDSIDKTSAEINTIILANCIISENERPIIGSQVALNLGLADRTKIIEQILERNPGPRLGEVKKACKACGEEIDLPLGLTDLFRL
jgi:hypothetical protein